MMSCGITDNYSMNGFVSKADALKFSIQFTSMMVDGNIVPQYDKAQELFKFICKNVNLPDVKKEPYEDLVALIQEKFRQLSDQSQE